MLNVFTQDAFDVLSMTTAINKVPYQPRKLGSMNLFTFKGIRSTAVAIEQKSGRLTLIPASARGTHDNVSSREQRTVRTISCVHLQEDGSVLADDVQGIRAFGSEDTTEAVVGVVNEKLTKLRNDHETTHEYHRIGALQGKVLDADGASTLYNIFELFGITETEFNFDLTNPTPTVELKIQCERIMRALETALGAATYTSVQCFCGDTFWEKLITHPEVKTSYERWRDGAFKRELQDRAQGFEWCGINWSNYRGKVGNVDFIPPTIARFFPLGVMDLFQENFAPADFVEAVNTPGLRYYAKQEMMKFGKGVEIHTQSNPLMLCTQPGVLIKGLMNEGSSSSA